MHIVIGDLGLEHLWVVYPGDLEYPLADRISALPLGTASGLSLSLTGPVSRVPDKRQLALGRIAQHTRRALRLWAAPVVSAVQATSGVASETDRRPPQSSRHVYQRVTQPNPAIRAATRAQGVRQVTLAARHSSLPRGNPISKSPIAAGRIRPVH